ncbi:efflux RND transporter permease subunit [Prolixibacteraceae bacterium JC049]|nr:efflux RND transporter permease subunit [Prolixibacteraceae bacterium JC049]
MKKLIRFFTLQPTLVNLAMLILMGVGIMQLLNTQKTNFPKGGVRFIDVSVAYPGASPEEVEEGVTVKIEDNLEGIYGIDRVTSQSMDNRAAIQVELIEGADANAMLVEVKNAIDKINNFPAKVEQPSVEKRDLENLTMSFAIESENSSLFEIKDIAKKIENDFVAHEGLSRVVIEGIPDEEIEISVRENDLRRFNISLAQISKAIAASNIETFGGTIENELSTINIKADSRGYYSKELQNIKVAATKDGHNVYLKDVATIKDQFKDDATGRYMNRKPVVTMTVNTLNDEDVLENAEFVKEYIANYNKTHEGVHLKILEDGTVILKERIDTMTSNGIVGIFLVLIVLALFLDRYLALWVAVGIPISLLGMFILVPIKDMTINAVSLFGFILVLGILVDDAVVVGENIYKHRKEKGKTPIRAAVDGTMEMVTPVIISLLTTATAFALFFFLPEKIGEFFGEMAFVVIAVLVIALIETFIILPGHIAHARGMKEDVKLYRIERWSVKFMEWLRDKTFMPMFNRAVLKNRTSRVVTISIFAAVLAGCSTLVGSGRLSFTFFPNIDDDAFFVELEMPPGTPKEETKSKLFDIEDAVWKVNKQYSDKRTDGKEIVRFVEVITGPFDNQGKLKITFLPGNERGINSFELSRSIANASPKIPEARRLIFGLGATSSLFGLPVAFALKSENLEELRLARDELVAGMRQNKSVSDVSDTDKSGILEYRISLRPNAEAVGLTLGDVMRQVRSGFFGIEAQSLQRGDEEVEVWVRYPKMDRQSKAQLLDMRISTPSGDQIPLRELANIDDEIGTLSIDHIDGIREVRVEANVANKNVSAPKAIMDIEENIIPTILEKYPSVSYSIEGQARQSSNLMNTILVVGPLTLFFIFALIVFNCNSFSQAITIFSLFPFTLIGVIIGHYIHGMALNIFSLIGTIALIGVFVNNALVFTSTLNEQLAEGADFKTILKETAFSRFRPIILTSITTIAGLAPLISSGSLSALFLKGPAIAVAYGLLFGIFNVLFLMPTFLITLNKLRYKWHKFFNRKSNKTAIDLEPAVRLAHHKKMQ